jgi:hypothetical protein
MVESNRAPNLETLLVFLAKGPSRESQRAPKRTKIPPSTKAPWAKKGTEKRVKTNPLTVKKLGLIPSFAKKFIIGKVICSK